MEDASATPTDVCAFGPGIARVADALVRPHTGAVSGTDAGVGGRNTIAFSLVLHLAVVAKEAGKAFTGIL